ncbi:LOW QUALITY PROTEIN: protein quaking-B-like [Amphiura filiformis]|uniref:LOW QUALITY PROTEIN: protein quaking-B-like n=1 Tax=Amphiura filiformis TaxID=82378 RepID=UPI003B21FBD9
MVPNMFIHVERVLDEEIARVRKALYSVTSENKPLVLPDAQGPVVQLSEKLYVPVKTYPDFNFVGRILGPRGMTAKQLEKDTGCKIMVRGKGSMRDKMKEEQNRGKPNWEHLNEELHVLITVEDSTDRAKAKIARAVEEIKKLLVPTFNFVGRILGPRGMTAKQLEKDTGCKIMVRGKGSMRDKMKEEQNRGKPNWEHLNEELHVLITVEDSTDRAKAKIARAVEEIKKLLVPTADGEDELKKRQLMELAIMNGTYRDNTKPQPNHIVTPLNNFEQLFSDIHGYSTQNSSPRAMAPPGALIPQPLRSPTPGHPGLAGMMPTIIPRMTASQALLANGAPPPMMPSSDGTSIIYAPFHGGRKEHYPYALTPTLLEYPPVSTDGAIGAVPKVRRTVREHPYQRAVLDAREFAHYKQN